MCFCHNCIDFDDIFLTERARVLEKLLLKSNFSKREQNESPQMVLDVLDSYDQSSKASKRLKYMTGITPQPPCKKSVLQRLKIWEMGHFQKEVQIEVQKWR